MKNQTIEQVVEEVCDFDFEVKLWTDKGFNEFKKVLNQALQAQRDAGAREERENIIEIVKFTKFRNTQPQEPYHKYLQQAKGVDYIRNKILKALTPPTK